MSDLVEVFCDSSPNRATVHSCKSSEYNSLRYISLLDSVVLTLSATAYLVESGQKLVFDAPIDTVTTSGAFLLADGTVFEISASLELRISPAFPPDVKLLASASTFAVFVASGCERRLQVRGECGVPGLSAMEGNREKIFDFPIIRLAASDTAVVGSFGSGGGVFGFGSIGNFSHFPCTVESIACGLHVVAVTAVETPSRLWLYGNFVQGEFELGSRVTEISVFADTVAVLTQAGSVRVWGERFANFETSDAASDASSVAVAMTSVFVLKRPPLPGGASDHERHVQRGFRPAFAGRAKAAWEVARDQLAVAKKLETVRQRSAVSQFWEGVVRGEISDKSEILQVWEECGWIGGSYAAARVVCWPERLYGSLRANEAGIPGILNREKYGELVQLVGEGKKSEIIGLDIRRTYREEMPEALVIELGNLLEIFQQQNLHGEYVQGYSFLAGMLLEQIPSPWRAYNCFVAVLHWPLMQKLYQMDLTPIQIVFFEQYLALNSPQLLRVLTDSGLGIHSNRALFVLEWFLTLFTKTLEPESAQLAWDTIVLHGELGIFSVATAVVMEIEPQLLARRGNSDALAEGFLRLPRAAVHASNLLARLRLVKLPAAAAPAAVAAASAAAAPVAAANPLP